MIRNLFLIFLIFLGALSAKAGPNYCAGVLAGPRTIYDMNEDSLVKKNRQQFKPGGFVNYLEGLRSYRDQTLKKFINTVIEGSAPVKGLFLASFRPQTGDMYNDQQEFVGHTFTSPTSYVFRGMGKGESDALPTMTTADRSVVDWTGHIGEATESTFTNYVIRGIKSSLRALYSSFQKQGPERQALVDIVQQQDKDESALVTHFVVLNGTSALAHAQILVSESAAEPLHIEIEWPGQAPHIPGNRRGEVGRLFIFRPDELDPNSLVGRRHWENMDSEASLIRIDFLRRMFAWANHDASLDSLSFQVNTGVLAVLKRLGVNIELGQHYVVSKEYEGQVIPEHILVFEKEGMQKVEDSLTRKVLSMQLEKFLATPSNQAEKVILRFNRNEFRPLFASGLFGSESGGLINNFLSSNANTPLPQNPTVERILSADLSHPEQNGDGLFLKHVLSPAQVKDGNSLKGPLASISSMEISQPNFSNGVLSWPQTGTSPATTSIIEIHLTRKAATKALEILHKNY